jgi:hypothetical protein
MENALFAYVLNLLDLAFTLHALGHGAVELNPLMRCVPVQIFYKVFVVGALLWWLSKRKERIAQLGLKTAAVVFAAVDLWHIVNLAIIWL